MEIKFGIFNIPHNIEIMNFYTECNIITSLEIRRPKARYSPSDSILEVQDNLIWSPKQSDSINIFLTIRYIQLFKNDVIRSKSKKRIKVMMW